MGDRRLTRLTILLLVAVAALAVGCGSSDNSKSGGSGGAAESTANAEAGSEAGSETGSEANAETGSEASAEPSTESDTSSSGSSLPKRDFVKRASKICQVGAETALAFEPEDRQASEKEYMPEMIEVSIVPNFQDVVSQIEALGIPSGDEVQVEEFLDALTQAIDELESDPGSYASIPDVEKTLHPAGDKAKAYTLTGCVFG